MRTGIVVPPADEDRARTSMSCGFLNRLFACFAISLFCYTANLQSKDFDSCLTTLQITIQGERKDTGRKQKLEAKRKQIDQASKKAKAK